MATLIKIENVWRGYSPTGSVLVKDRMNKTNADRLLWHLYLPQYKMTTKWENLCNGENSEIDWTNGIFNDPPINYGPGTWMRSNQRRQKRPGGFGHLSSYCSNIQFPRAFNLGTSYSFSFWIIVSALDPGWPYEMPIITDGRTPFSGQYNNAGISLYSDDILLKDGDSLNETILTGLPLNEWLHITATTNGVKAWIYVNGIVKNEINFAGSPVSVNSMVRKYDTGGGIIDLGYYGPIDDVGIWKRCLSAGEVWGIYQDSRTGNYGLRSVNQHYLKSKSFVQNNNNVDLYISGPVQTSYNIDLYMRGYVPEPESIPLFLKVYDVSHNDVDLYVFGAHILDSDIPLFISGVLKHDSGMNLVISGKENDPLNNFVFLTITGELQPGETFDEFGYPNSSMNMFIMSNDSSFEEMPMNLFISGTNYSDQDSISLYIHNEQEFSENSISLYVKGNGDLEDGLSETGYMNLFLRRRPANSVPMFVCGPWNQTTDNLSLLICGAYPESDSINMSIPNVSSSDTESLNFYTHGF